MKPFDRRLLMYRIALTAMIGALLLVVAAYQQKQRELDSMRTRAEKWEAIGRSLDDKMHSQVLYQKQRFPIVSSVPVFKCGLGSYPAPEPSSAAVHITVRGTIYSTVRQGYKAESSNRGD